VLVGQTNMMLRVPVPCIVGGALWMGLAAACTRASFDDPDPASQLAALERAIEANDRSKIPEMIELLDSDDPAVRLFAILGLERMTGETHGYDFAAPEAERHAATERWVAWYNAGLGRQQPIEEEPRAGEARVRDGAEGGVAGDGEGA